MNKLTFKDLKAGEKFIIFPDSNNNESVLYYKWHKENGFCAKNFTQGTFSDVSGKTEVIKII